ncbi:YezD family protein [Paenibacillus sp.]|uniref:YezD family protein n=1 Tax=Paenibacillus sp. TaxID=58172 RepID=UPI002D6D4C05|nr:YezD family protein [Paenibacillus sp.]HZG56860.1 YezD family protein [Paenibacillus sp.]
MREPKDCEPVWLRRIEESLAGLQYGSVLIVVHDGRIVQIERTEKRRFDSPTRLTGGEGAIEN